MNIILQGSSKSWSGSSNLCLNLVDGQPVIYWTIKKIVENFPGAGIVIAAPSFDEGGRLSDIAREFKGRVDVFFGHDDSPLLRMIAAHDKFFKKEEYFLRIDALHLFFDPADLKRMYRLAVKKTLDCLKFADDYPPPFTADIYRIDALVRLKDKLPPGSPFMVHPKYFMMKDPGFKCGYFKGRKLNKRSMIFARDRAKDIYLERDESDRRSIRSGDQLSFHYTLALPYIKKTDKVLDTACGTGFGLSRLAKAARKVWGADLSQVAIDIAKRRVKGTANIKLSTADATDLPFKSKMFDVVTSFETLEHVAADAFINELWRVLKPGGRLIISTPQNSLGEFPVNPHHVREYSLAEFKRLFEGLFGIERIIGIKQGTIFFENDPFGNNTFAVLVKKSRSQK